MIRQMYKKYSIILFVFLLICTFKLHAQGNIISPSNGLWANYQSLVLDLPQGYEAYYSFTGENPLVTGFAYDGPVLLELSGDVVVDVAIVGPNTTTQSYKIQYTVNLQEKPSYIPNVLNEATLVINDDKMITIPPSVSYSLGHNSTIYSGESLRIAGKMLFERYVLLTLYDKSIPHRYVVQVGSNELYGQEVDALEPIEITDWNYVTFKSNDTIIYSVDGQALRQTRSRRIYVDRSEDRVIRWRESKSEDFLTFTLPKRPEVLGLPSVAAVNEEVILTLSDKRFSFGFYTVNGQVLYSDSYFIDTLKGDAFGFSDNIMIFYDGIKQGTENISFILDKISPDKPVFTASDTSGYARDSISIDVQTNDKVQYYIPSPITAQNGFDSNAFQDSDFVKDFDLSLFSNLDSSSIVLMNTSGVAMLYTVYMYTIDFAGNTSEIVRYRSVIDPYNYYVEQANKDSNELGIGTKDKPFTDIYQMIAVLNKNAYQKFYFDGVFTDIPSFELTQDTTFIASESTRLQFSQNTSIHIKDSVVTFLGGTLEQNIIDESKSLNNTFINAQNSQLVFSNLEFLLTGAVNATLINIQDSELEIENSGLTVQSVAYGSALKANNSTIQVRSVRYVLASETSVGLSVVDSDMRVEDADFTGIGQHSRSIELINSDFSLENNSFKFEGTSKKSEYPAVWVDDLSNGNVIGTNVFQGYTTLFAK